MSITRDEYAAGVKAGAQKVGTTATMGLIVAKFPLIANPVLYAIAEHFVDEIFEQVINKTEFGVFYLYVDMRVSKQGRAFHDAVMAEVMAKMQGNLDEYKRLQAIRIERFNELASLTTL